MNRQQKVECVAQLRERLSGAEAAIVAQYQGLTVGELTRLRRELREVRGEYRVAKNRLLRLAVADTPFVPLGGLLKGQNGLVIGYGDPATLARTVTRYARDTQKLVVKGAVAEGSFVSPEGLEEIARLPGREVVLGRLLSLLCAPATRLLRTIQEPAAAFVRLLEAARKAKEPQGGDTASSGSDKA